MPMKRSRNDGVPAPPQSVRPWYFQKQDGNTFSRANSLRPMDRSTRQYFAYSAIFQLSLGTTFYIAAFYDEFSPDDPTALYGYAVLGSCFLVLGFGALLVLALETLGARLLAKMPRITLRSRLRNKAKSYRYTAQPAHLRGVAIGAVFFGALCVVTVIITILRQLGVIVVPA